MTKHKIKAYLYENLLTDDPNDYVARAISERSLSVADICDSAVARGGSDISVPAMEHGVQLFLKEMAYLLGDGYSVNTGYFTAAVNIKGVFNSPDETFNPAKHSVQFLFNQGEALRAELPGVEVEILGVAESGLTIVQVADLKSGTVNDRLTPGRNLRIKGSKLKLAGDNAAVGVYFVNQATNESTKVDTDDIVINNPSELLIIIPQLAVGTYTLQVTTQYGGSALLKEPRSVAFDKPLTV